MAIKDKNGKFNSALLDYVQQGSIKVLQSFLGRDNSDSRDSDGRTLLHYAAESNNVSMTKHFINNNYDVDIRDNGGQSPLMLAVAKDSFDTAKMLVEAGADIYMVDNNDAPETPPSKLVIDLRNPALNENHQIVKSILKRLQKDYYNDEKRLLEYLRGFGCSLVQILSLRNANMTRLMLENGYSVNERDLRTKGTALHEAVKLTDLDNVRVLLKFGASVDALDVGKYPPLYYLYDYYRSGTREEEEEKVKIMKILIDHGALSSQASDDPITPVQYIFDSGILLAITTLMQYYIGFNSYASLYRLIDHSNDTALEVVRGKNINVNYHNQDSLLSLAVYMGSFRKVQLLLEHGADPNAVDAQGGKTPLFYAFTYLYLYSEDNLVPIVRLLLQYGADAQYVYTDDNQEQKTVFDLENSYGVPLGSVIAHLAMIESCGETITDVMHRKIDSRDTYERHFQICKKQIEEMKNTTVNGSVTLFKLLTASHLKITGYARDAEFTAKFEEAMKDERLLDPYYSTSLRRRVGKAVHVAKLKEEAVVVMNNIFGYRVNNYHEILSEIVDYLNCDDLKNICRIFNLQESESFQLDTFFV